MEILIYPGLTLGISITFQETREQGGATATSLLPAAIRRRVGAVLRPFDGQVEETAKRPQTPITVTWQCLWISITREQCWV